MPDRFDIRPLETVPQVFDASAVLAEVWGGDRSGMPANLLRALAHAGNYAVGVYEGERMRGASVAFFGPPAARSLHSHITGVLPAYQGIGLGRMLKHHQRAWALERGVGHITWTFDPLVARNAHLNLAVLGAQATEYLVDHYGPMDDGVNRGDESDRILVDWAVAASVPRPPVDLVATVAVPPDIEEIRRSTPVAAATWRRVVRDELTAHLDAGLRIAGFDAARGGYLLVAG